MRSIWLTVVLSAVVAGLALWPACSLAASETWNNEGAQRAAEEAPRLEAEREAKHREEAERPAKEAAEKATHECEIREAGERTGREAAEREAAERAASVHGERCVVPRLHGDSPAAARRALQRGHCNLGKVTAPRNHRGALIVAGQSVRAGRALADGAKVAIVLAGKRG